MTEPSVQKPVDSARLEWRGECCIDSLGSQHDQLLKVLEDGVPIDVDLSEVSRIDTAGLQLLMCFILEAQRRGVRVVMSRVSEAVMQSARSAGVLELLGV